MDKIKLARKRTKHLIIAMLIVTLVTIVVSLRLGRFSLSWQDLGGFLKGLVFNNLDQVPPKTKTALWNIRIPRIIGALLVGASLATAGVGYQALFENPMASPDILGVTSGASFGAAIAIIMNLGSRYIVLVAFIFGLLAFFLTYFTSRKIKLQKTLSLIITGMLTRSFFSAGVSFIKLVADQDRVLPEITFWLMGSLSAITWEKVLLVIPFMVVGLVLIYINRLDLNRLAMGEEKAQTIGVNVKKVRFQVTIGASLLSASSVAISGSIGWVGLLVPHICRLFVGEDYRYLVPAVIFTGASFLLVVDTVARTVTATEIPLGILTAVVGIPIFLVLLLRGGDLTSRLN